MSLIGRGNGDGMDEGVREIGGGMGMTRSWSEVERLS